MSVGLLRLILALRKTADLTHTVIITAAEVPPCRCATSLSTHRLFTLHSRFPHASLTLHSLSAHSWLPIRSSITHCWWCPPPHNTLTIRSLSHYSLFAHCWLPALEVLRFAIYSSLILSGASCVILTSKLSRLTVEFEVDQLRRQWQRLQRFHRPK